MSLVQICGGTGMAELIASQVSTRSILPNCYFPEKKVYGFADTDSGVVFYFDEESCQYLEYAKVDSCMGEYILLVDLMAELLGGAA